MYEVILSEKAIEGVALLQKHCPNALPKLSKLLEELKLHPRTGTGKVEQLKGCSEETWSRRINQEHRLVYRIHDNTVQVLVLATYGHYK